MNSVLTTDFRHEYEQEQTTWLRRRFLWYTGVNSCLHGLMFLMVLVTWVAMMFLPAPGVDAGSNVIGVISGAISVGLYLYAYIGVRRGRYTRERLLEFAYLLIVVAGIASVVMSMISYVLTHERIDQALEKINFNSFLAFSLSQLFSIFISHFFACLFLPWTPRESFRPLLPLWAVYGICALVFAVVFRQRSPGTVAITTAMFPLVGLPGMAICWWRHSRFRDRFLLDTLQGRYAQMKRELSSAQQIHESLFPKAGSIGGIRFDYRYEPMRLIGGDYLHARFEVRNGDEPGALSLLVLDVTGHGVPAALTVNRLYGEVERLYAEHPGIRPAQVLRALNRYVYLTLSNHSLFVTALAARVCGKARELEYCNAGHPPAFIRAVDGTIDQLDSTAMVLGVTSDDDYETETLTRPFGPGDVLIAYTDGAMETRNSHGRMLGVDGMRGIIAGHKPRGGGGGWSEAILSCVTEYRHGPASDDTLVVEMCHELATESSSEPMQVVAPRAQTTGVAR
ncbi:MAG: PP2C family protein-serine/threonine phosphatase [Phycisphaerales bacterium]